MTTRFLIIASMSYLFGSIPFGYLLVRIFRGEDVRQSGSGNIGATNVSRKSPVLGVITLFLDALKGSLAVAVGIQANLPLVDPVSTLQIPTWRDSLATPDVAVGAATAALFAILGHMFPVWLKFRGGKGVATALGAFVIIAPKSVLLSAVVFLVAVLALRYVSLGSIAAVAAFPNTALLLHEYANAPMALALMFFSSGLIIIMHHANIRRLLAGTENRLGSKHT
jgi:glycerol-3-phosphate acyltransferase PlsY